MFVVGVGGGEVVLEVRGRVDATELRGAEESRVERFAVPEDVGNVRGVGGSSVPFGVVGLAAAGDEAVPGAASRDCPATREQSPRNVRLLP